MCKNLFVSGIKPEVAKKKLWDFLIAATPYMTENDQHGLGYAALSSSGLWGERWLDPKESWKFRTEWSSGDELVKTRFGATVEGEPKYNSFGTADPDTTYAVILHARMATCEKGLKNTHPFVSGNVALIHNGIIRNTHALKNITSTCDSECILNEYTDRDVMNVPDNISKVTEALRGYYACGVLHKAADGVDYLDIFRSSQADLNACYIEELDAVVVCTRTSIITSTCKDLKWKHGNFFKIKDEVMVRLNAKTGEFVGKHSFKVAQEYNYNNDYEWQRGRVTYARPESVTSGTKTSDAKVNAMGVVKEVATKVIESVTQNSMLSGTGTTEHGTNMRDPFYYHGDGYGYSGLD